MPLYEFHCSECGNHFDEFKTIAERDTPEPCPECGARAERLISAAALGGTSSGSLSSGGGCSAGG